MPTRNREVVLANHWLIRTSGYPAIENYYWTKCSGVNERTDVGSYKSPFFNRTFQIPSGNRVYQPIIVSGELYYGSLTSIVNAWRNYKNQPITVIQQAEVCTTAQGTMVRGTALSNGPRTIKQNSEKTITYVGCIWVALDYANADRSQQVPSNVQLTFTYTEVNDEFSEPNPNSRSS